MSESAKTGRPAPKKLGARHKARKRAVDFLFEAEARDLDPVALAADRRALSAEDDAVAPVNAYTDTLVAGVAESLNRIDAVISDHLHQWTLARLPAVDRAILRVAVWELLNATDVPPVVAVDEAVELAKQLSTDESPSFVNGVLGQIVSVAPQVRAAAAARPAAEQTAAARPAAEQTAAARPAAEQTAARPAAEQQADDTGDRTD
ncbi:hypothetical protein RhoFasK5_00298|nr:hypothetical protein [Rhodococcus kroppenstedtii]